MEEGQTVNLTTFLKNKKNQVNHNHNGKMFVKAGTKKESKCFICKSMDTQRRISQSLRID